MKQMIAKNRKEAIAFVEGGNGHSQRAAYWLQGKIINRAEVIPGQKTATIKENVGGCWWDAKTTIAQKFGIDPVSTAAATLGRKGGASKTEAKQSSSRENGKLGGRPKRIEMLLRYSVHPVEGSDGWRVLDPRDGAPLTDEIFDKKSALQWVRENKGKPIYED